MWLDLIFVNRHAKMEVDRLAPLSFWLARAGRDSTQTATGRFIGEKVLVMRLFWWRPWICRAVPCMTKEKGAMDTNADARGDGDVESTARPPSRVVEGEALLGGVGLRRGTTLHKNTLTVRYVVLTCHEALGKRKSLVVLVMMVVLSRMSIVVWRMRTTAAAPDETTLRSNDAEIPTVYIYNELNETVPTFFVYDEQILAMDLEVICEGDMPHDEDLELIRSLRQHHKRTYNPNDAELFVIPIPVFASYSCDEVGHPERLDRAMSALTRSRWFRRYNGSDHIMGAFHWKFNAYCDDELFLPNRWKSVLEEVTMTRYEYYGESKWEHQQPNRLPLSLYSTVQWENTKRSIVVPYVARSPIVDPSFQDWRERPYVIWYHTRKAKSAHGGTELRKRPLTPPQNWTHVSIGYDIPYDEWLAGWSDSKFCLVIRGDTPSSHAFSNAIAGGCIPVIISSYFEQVALPFNTTVGLETFSVRLSEFDWLQGGVTKLVDQLALLDVGTVKRKLVALRQVQPLLLWNHPQSQVASLVLQQAMRMISTKRAGPVSEKANTTDMYIYNDPSNVTLPTFYIYDDHEMSMEPERLCKGDVPLSKDWELIETLRQRPERTLNPGEAVRFVLPIPLYISWSCDRVGHLERLNRTMTAIAKSPWFQRHRGSDHWLGAHDWRFGTYENDEEFLPERWRFVLDKVLKTRYEYFGEVKLEEQEPKRLPLSFRSTFWKSTNRKIDLPPVLNKTLVTPSYGEWKQRPFVVWQENCSVDLNDKSEMVAFQQSQYCLMMGGETISTRSFRDVISSACIPVIIASPMEQVAVPFQTAVDLASFTVRLPKSEWLQGGLAKLLPRLASLRESAIQSKLAALEEMQHTIRWNHPEPRVPSLTAFSVSC